MKDIFGDCDEVKVGIEGCCILRLLVGFIDWFRVKFGWWIDEVVFCCLMWELVWWVEGRGGSCVGMIGKVG